MDTPPDAAGLLAELTSGEGSRVWSASGRIIQQASRETLLALAPHLPHIRRATAGLELGGMLLDNDLHLAQALRVIGAAGDRRCSCEVYEGYLGYDPEQEQARGHTRTLRTTPPDWNMTFWCRCLRCAREYEVEQGASHTTWWKWTRLDPPRG